MRIALIADTHLPRGKRSVPEPCVAALQGADLIVHGGDFVEPEVLDWLESLGPAVRAVHGNVDAPVLRARLPETVTIEVGDAKLGVVHDAGPAAGRLPRLRQRFPDADAVVFGHSHMPLHEQQGGFQIFNPGSPTERRRAPRRSFGQADITRGRIHFRHVWLG